MRACVRACVRGSWVCWAGARAKMILAWPVWGLGVTCVSAASARTILYPWSPWNWSITASQSQQQPLRLTNLHSNSSPFVLHYKTLDKLSVFPHPIPSHNNSRPSIKSFSWETRGKGYKNEHLPVEVLPGPHLCPVGSRPPMIHTTPVIYSPGKNPGGSRLPEVLIPRISPPSKYHNYIIWLVIIIAHIDRFSPGTRYCAKHLILI